MSSARPFAYNPSQIPISGTIQVGQLAIGTPTNGFTNNPPFWNGPDEELGYVIAFPVTGNTQPTPVTTDKVYLSETYKATDITLSNNNQTATQVFSYSQSVLGENQLLNNDRVMFSVQFDSTNPSVGVGGRVIGVGTTEMNYQGPFDGYPGNDVYSAGFSDAGNLYFTNGSVQTGFPGWTSGDIIDIALIVNDLSSSSWWIRVNGGYWNNNPSANPEFFTGSVQIPVGESYIALCPYIYGSMTIQNTPIYGVPSGYKFLGNTFASVGFLRTTGFTDNSFINLSEYVANQNGTPQTFTSANNASVWLTNNGFWNSYNGPVLYLDANNISSYPGTGTIWYDISGNGNDVTMVNFNSINWNNSGPVYFSTGVDGWFNNPSGSNLPIGNESYTLIIWVQLGSDWGGSGLMSIGSFGTTNQSNAFRTASTNILLNYWWANDLGATSSVFPTNGWFNAVATYDGTTRSILVNGVILSSDFPVGHNVVTSALQIAKTGGVEYLNGNIGEVLIYNRGLTSEEILGIFNTTKSRYGYVPNPTPTPTNTPTGTPIIATQTPTPTPTNTPTGTPIIATQTPTPTPTLTQTPVTEYSFNLVVLPYNFPTSGNTIMVDQATPNIGTTNPNVFATNNNAIYFNAIDTNGINRSNYFASFTGQSITLTISQTGSTAIYSGDSKAFQSWIDSGVSGFTFGYGIAQPGYSVGTTTLIQSAPTNWVTGQTVTISAVVNGAGVTPTPTATSVTPTPTPTSGATGDGWLFYYTDNTPVTSAPTNNGNTAFIYGGSPNGTYNPNYTGGTFNLYFNTGTTIGTSYLSQFTTLNDSGGNITISQGSSTAIYSGTSLNYQINSGFLVLSVNSSAQMIQSASTPFVSGTSINVVVN